MLPPFPFNSFVTSERTYNYHPRYGQMISRYQINQYKSITPMPIMLDILVNYSNNHPLQHLNHYMIYFNYQTSYHIFSVLYLVIRINRWIYLFYWMYWIGYDSKIGSMVLVIQNWYAWCAGTQYKSTKSINQINGSLKYANKSHNLFNKISASIYHHHHRHHHHQKMRYMYWPNGLCYNLNIHISIQLSQSNPYLMLFGVKYLSIWVVVIKHNVLY